MTKKAIRSDLSKNEITKLSYSDQGPYQIILNTGCGSYFVRKLNTSDSPELQFITYNLYSLFPSLKPYELIHTTDTRYLN